MNNWKNSKLLMLLSMLMVLLLSSCATSLGKTDPSEYRLGERASESFAKRDAMKNHCVNISPGYRLEMAQHRDRHLEVLKGEEKSESYIRGFKSGYRRHYIQYMDLYCGEVWERKK